MAGPRLTATRIARSAGLLLVVCTLGCSSTTSSDSTGSKKADPTTVIDVTGSIGGIKPGESRAAVEHRLGAGQVVSTSTRSQKTGGPLTLTRVFYAASHLAVLYVADDKHPASVFALFTGSPRYHTRDGLRVGSTLAAARRTHGIQCYQQLSFFACQGGLGYEKPVTSFTVKSGRVVQVVVVAVAD